MAISMDVAVLLTGINIVLILSLLYVYVKNYRKIRSSHTGGLLLFASLFLAQNLVALYYGLTMSEFFAKDLGEFLLMFTALQVIAFTILNWITWK
jgi:hypothetical protein